MHGIIGLVIKIYEFILCKAFFSAYARKVGFKYGSGCRFINVTPNTFGSEPYLIRFGDRVSISEGVRFICHDGALWSIRRTRADLGDIDYFAPVRVGDDVFIGMNAIVLPGVNIGSGSVIAAGAVVSSDVPEGMIYGGVPAKVLMSMEEYVNKIADRRYLNTKRMSKKQKMKYILDELN